MASEVDLQAVLSVLAEEGFVHLADGQWNWTNESYPADAVSLRSVSSDNFVVVDCTNGERVIGETDFTSGPATLHEKAIYILEGQLFQVERLDFDGRKAYLRAVDCDYYTDAITYTKVTILDMFDRDPGSRCDPGSRIRTRLRSRSVDPTITDPGSRSRTRPARPELDPTRLTAKSTSCPAWSASRRSSSTRTRTSAPASSICPSSRCTPRPTG